MTRFEGFPIYRDDETRFEGFTIYRDDDVGYYWQEGGFHDTLAECQAEIAAWNRRNSEPREDSP